jgi:3'-5' exoribonuclease
MLNKELTEIQESVLKEKLLSAESEVCARIEDESCKELIYAFHEDYGMKFARMVASSRHHHNYESGLLDHSLDVFRMALAISHVHQNKLNRDILLTGAYLHDIGKIVSYEDAPDLKSGKRPKWEYQTTEESKTQGHFADGLWIISHLLHKYDDIGMDIETERAICHIIASHHGLTQFRYGSLVDPNTLEAYVVFCADFLSSRIG